VTRLPLSVIVPARNEAETIARVVRNLLTMPWVDEVVVVDNASTDGTADQAREAGARSVYEARQGMGHAVRAGLAAAAHDWVMKVDADLEKFDFEKFANMVGARDADVGLIKGDWQDPKDNMPMTRLLVKPALAWMFPGLARLRSPNTGIYLVNRALIAHAEIVGSYAADLDVMLRVYATGATVAEVDIGRIRHDMRDVGHYNKMAETIMGFLLERQAAEMTQELVVVSDTAEEVLRCALGLCVVRARAGALVPGYRGDDGAGAEAVRGALAGFATARVLPLTQVKGFELRGPEERVQVISSFAEGADGAFAQAGALQTRLAGEEAEIGARLLMPPVGGGGFAADHGFDVRDGDARKAEAWQAAGMAGTPVRREVFQSHVESDTDGTV
jgi:hypothetical protein